MHWTPYSVSLTSSTFLWSFVQYSMHSMLCISTPPRSNNVYWHMPFNVYTTDKVTMGVNEWLPHYLTQSRSHCNSNFKSKRVLIWKNNPKWFVIRSFNSNSFLIPSFGENSNYRTEFLLNSKQNLADEWLRINRSRPVQGWTWFGFHSPERGTEPR